jgi:DNA-binding response OmpR family regulator
VGKKRGECCSRTFDLCVGWLCQMDGRKWEILDILNVRSRTKDLPDRVRMRCRVCASLIESMSQNKQGLSRPGMWGCGSRRKLRVDEARVAMKTAEILQFGEFEVDLSARALRRNGERVALNRRSFEALLYLLERPGG